MKTAQYCQLLYNQKAISKEYASYFVDLYNAGMIKRVGEIIYSVNNA